MLSYTPAHRSYLSTKHFCCEISDPASLVVGKPSRDWWSEPLAVPCTKAIDTYESIGSETWGYEPPSQGESPHFVRNLRQVGIL